MNSGRYFAGGLLLVALLALPMPGQADTFMREGGKAYHSRMTCPALNGFKVLKVESTLGLVPCRVCCKETASDSAPTVGGMKLGQPRVLSIQEMSGTNKAKESAEHSGAEQRHYGWGRTFSPLHHAYGSDYVVSNGQVLDVYDGEAVDINAPASIDFGGIDFGGE